jgi:O-antigen/teichoic acid export membrane protein
MNNLVKNYLLNLGYQLITVIIPFVTIPYLSRVLGPYNLGVESYTSSIIAIFIAITNAGTTIYSVRQVAFLKEDKKKLIKEIYNIQLLRLVISTLTLILLIVYIKDSEYKSIFLVQILLLLGSTVFDCTWYYIGKEKFKIIVLRNLAIKIMGLVLILIFVRNEEDLLVYIWISTLTIFIPNISLFYLMIREIGFPRRYYFSIRRINRMSKEMMPFFLMGIIAQVYMNMDKVILEKKGLIVELGYYSQFMKSYSVFLAPITAVGTILMPRLSNINDNKTQSESIYIISSNFIFILCIPIIIGLYTISSDFVYIFYGSNFIEYEPLFKLGLFLIFTGSLSNIIIQQIILPNKLEKQYNLSLIISSVLRFIIIIIFLEKLGVFAAVIGYIIGEIILMSICSYKAKEIFEVKRIIYNKNNFKILISGVVMYFSLSLFNIPLYFKVGFGFFIYVITLILLKENLVLLLINKLRKKRKVNYKSFLH